MDSPALTLQDVLGDAIIAQLATDSLTAPVVTNPTQDMVYPYVVIGEDTESTEDTNRDQLKSSIAHTMYVHSDSMTECKQVAASVLRAAGPNGSTLDLGTDHYELRRELEANDITREVRPEGSLYHALIRVRFFISHR